MSAILNTISNSEFSKMSAEKIFESIRDEDIKVVLKNNKPECILMSPEYYDDLMETLNDMKMTIQIKDRMQSYDPKDNISFEEHLKKENITYEDLKNFDDVEIS